MEHSTHAHPLPNRRDASRDLYASYAITSTPVPPHQDEDLNHQARRLQLRNAGFRGPTLPFRRISPFIGPSTNAIEAFGRLVNKENSPLIVEKRTLYSEDLPYKPVNILQEIHDSARKRKQSPKPGFCAIYEDVGEREELNDKASPILWYKEGSNNCTPVTQSGSPANMLKLREASLNPKTPPPLSSPLAKHVTARNANRASIRSPSSEATKYIEHLEAQLASVNARLESPSATKKRSTRLRALTVENRNLKHEVADWEKEYDARVQEERDRRNEVEMDLKQHVRQLEEDTDLKDARIGELEWELESMRAKFRDTDELKDLNVRLEKRIEILTNILVQSPTKLGVCSATTSPQKPDPSKRTPRPRSMLPKLPSSPGGIQLSLDPVSESAFWQPKSRVSSINIAESPDQYSGLQNRQRFSLPVLDDATRSPDLIRRSRKSGLFDHRTRASLDDCSAPSTSPPPSSVRTSASFGPVSWDLPDPADAESQSSRKRRSMRRFPSGSNSLRPLLLPTSTIGLSSPVSAPIYPSIETTTSQGTSGYSIDPTTSFFSRPLDTSPFPTPSQPSRRPSSTWVREQTLRALEGNLGSADRRESALDSGSSPSIPREPFLEFEEIGKEKRKRRFRPRSLEEELKEAHANQLRRTTAQVNALKSFEDTYIHAHEEKTFGHTGFGPGPTPSRSMRLHSSSKPRWPDLDDTPKAIELVDKVFISPWPSDSPPSTTSKSQQAHGIFYRLTSLITRTKQDPFIMARRLLANAWTLGSKRLGGMGWWLLGLIYGTRWRRPKRTADVGIAEGISTNDFDWQHFSAEASRSRAAHRYFRDHAGTSARESSLEPRHCPPSTLNPQRIMSLSKPSPRETPHLVPCPNCSEPSSHRTLRLWFQFSLAIVLAFGLAIKNGPGSLLVCTPRHLHAHGPITLKAQDQKPQNPDCPDGVSFPCRRNPNRSYDSIVFAEILGPEDFE